MKREYHIHNGIYVKCFVFNSFYENTYIVWDDTGEGVIIDPGCHSPREKEQILRFIEQHKITIVRLLNTHCHLDHIFGNRFISDKLGVFPEIHPEEENTMKMAPASAVLWGIYGFEPSPSPQHFLEDGEEVGFGESFLTVIHAPGHSPGHVMFYSEKAGILIAGDVIFAGSVGRTDLPGGDYPTLMHTIKEKVMTLPPQTIIYSGHGEPTTVQHEKENNPFAGEWV